METLGTWAEPADIDCPGSGLRSLALAAPAVIMFSISMALPAHLLERLPTASLRQHGVSIGQQAEGAFSPGSAPFSRGVEALNRVLPDHGLPRGAVIELAIHGGSALGTSLGLAACRAAQQAAVERGGSVPWCAFLDPSGTLYAPGVAAAGVELERLLVVRPSVEALS